jgi:hypothetical protein
MNLGKLTMSLHRNLKKSLVLLVLGCVTVPEYYDRTAFQNAISDKGVVLLGQKKWQKCTAGLEPQKCSGEATPMNRNSAIQFCRNLESDGGGWRLPDLIELRNLVKCESGRLPDNYKKFLWLNVYTYNAGCKDSESNNKLSLNLNAKIDNLVFPVTKRERYWTDHISSRHIGGEASTQKEYFFMYINFKDGTLEESESKGRSDRHIYEGDFPDKGYVRCIKDL